MFTNLLALNLNNLSVYEYIIGAILIVVALLVIFVVLMQEGRQANVGVISGAADSFMDKGAAKSLDQKLSKWTKVIAIGFFVLVLAGMLISNFLSNEDLSKADSSTTTTSSSTTTTAHEHTDSCVHDDSAVNDGELEWD